MSDKHLGNSPCPNCKSSRYFETVHTEKCPDCGLFFDYRTGKSSSVYQKMLDAKYFAEQEEETRQARKYEYDFYK